MDITRKYYIGYREGLSRLASDDSVLERIINRAYYESEMELGVNPKRFEQAHTANLSEKDFDYIRKVSSLAEKRLQDPEWLSDRLEKFENEEERITIPVPGIRYNDELFKGGRGILRRKISGS